MRRLILVLTLAISVCTYGQNPPLQTIDSLVRKANRFLMGENKDEKKAFELFLQSAQLGDTKSMNIVGLFYKQGRGVPANGIKAAEWWQKAGEAGNGDAWYNLGKHYKGMRPPDQDFERAYDCFEKGTKAADRESEYMKGYMLYKGLGCMQSYQQAAEIFKKWAYRGMGNSMYFLGLCYRNGYGIEMNLDSAEYWLNKAVLKGSKQAILELSMDEGENSDIKAKQEARKIINAAAPMPANPMNKYQKVERSISAGIITGRYTGYLLMYDWSGENIISVKPLILDIEGNDGRIFGVWKEGDSINVPIAANLTANSLLFQQTKYKRTDHYSPDKPIQYVFENAKIQWVRKKDTVYLAGNIQMFSPTRNEPHKPLSIALSKTGYSENDQLIQFTKADGSTLSDETLLVYPNPFKNVLTVDFELKEKSEVTTQLVTLDGKIVYENRAGVLDQGFYTLPLMPGNVVAGMYILVLKYGKKTQTKKIFKENL